MSATNPTLENLFIGGPPIRIERLLRVARWDKPGTAKRATFAALICWGGLLMLSAAQEAVYRNGSLWAFIQDPGACGRFLVALPMFILAESWCLPVLGRIVGLFHDFGMVRDAEAGRFDTAVEEARRWLNSTGVELAVLIVAYATTAALSESVHFSNLPRWSVHATASGLALSAAGAWQVWICLPLLLVLIYGWLWRQFVWTRLMWRISRLNLNLVATHPDCAGGLKFLNLALWTYAPLAFALASVAAGGVANQVLAGASIYGYQFLIGGLIVFVLFFFVAPFVLFAPTLRALKHRGVTEYGRLSCGVAHEFEAKWLHDRDHDERDTALKAPDFSATTDLFSIVSNVYQLRYIPVTTRAIGELLVFTVLPFVPVVLITIPVETLLQSVKGLLL